MAKTLEQFCADLNIEYNERVLPYYEKGLALYKEKGTFALDRDRLITFNRKYAFFRKWFTDVLAAAIEIEKDEDLTVFVYTLAALLEGMNDIEETLILKLPNRERLDTDYAPMFSFLYFLEDMVGDMEKRGVPFDVISDTLNGFDSEINDYYRLYNRGGVRIYVAWFALFVKKEMLRVGRFQFQIKKFEHPVRVYEKDGEVKILIDNADVHRKGMLFGSEGQKDEEGKYHAEIEENGDSVTGYPANEFGEAVPEKITLTGWREVLRKGDDVIGVHIPSDGPLDPDYSNESYERAKEIFQKCYPEYDFKAFTCFSWLLEKRLRGIMGRETNITKFADKYTGYPIVGSGGAIYSFLFNQPKRIPVEQLPEETSMHRLVKKYLLDGNIFYEKGGVILF